MDSETFRRDRRLRTSATHLAAWSVAVFAIDLRVSRAGFTAETIGPCIVIAAGTFLFCTTTERRIAKMAGPASESPRDVAASLWRIAFAILATGSAALVAMGREVMLVPLWLAGAGAAFAAWGSAIGFGWYRMLGAMLVAAGALDALVTARDGPAVLLRAVVLVVAVPAAALWTNRRYLWFRRRPR